MHLAPRRDSHDMGDSTPATFGYVARELGKRGIAFICAREAVGGDSLGPQLKQEFGGVYIANEKLTKASAEQLLKQRRRPMRSPSASGSSRTRTCRSA
jgi:hypothetical protein